MPIKIHYGISPFFDYLKNVSPGPRPPLTPNPIFPMISLGFKFRELVRPRTGSSVFIYQAHLRVEFLEPSCRILWKIIGKLGLGSKGSDVHFNNTLKISPQARYIYFYRYFPSGLRLKRTFREIEASSLFWFLMLLGSPINGGWKCRWSFYLASHFWKHFVVIIALTRSCDDSYFCHFWPIFNFKGDHILGISVFRANQGCYSLALVSYLAIFFPHN